jgi:hypothetical protein
VLAATQDSSLVLGNWLRSLSNYQPKKKEQEVIAPAHDTYTVNFKKNNRR